jgi:hypothetical protein
MSYYDEASLVFIPSGYKTSKAYSIKPTSGDGDLAFTRSNDTASRIGPDGLIEKVRTNRLLQSNTFNTTWTLTDASVTIGQSGYDGTSNAWLLNVTAGTGSQRVEQSIVSSTLSTYSVYLKAGTTDWVALRATGSPVNCLVWFDLSTGTKGANQNATNYTITSVGSGWYRCTLTTTTTIDKVYIYPATADDIAGLNCTSGDNILIQAAQLESGDVMTDYIATTTAAVSVGPVANVPRLDYLNSSCPRLLLEPQRTNTRTNSENATGSNWGAPTGVDITANQIASPDGYVSADLIAATSASVNHIFEQTFSATSATAFTYSYFAKANTNNQCFIYGFSDNGVFALQTAIFNLTNGTIVSNTGGGTASIVDYGNGWYRVSLTLTANATATGYWGIGLAKNGARQWTSDGTSIYMWGIQLETGAYATSYIPTLGAAVTRGADNASKTSASAIIGQTEGTMFWEFERGAAGFDYFQLNGGSASNWILLGIDGSNFLAFINNGGVNQVNILTSLSSGTHKAAFAYKNNDCVLYLDGVQIGTDTSASIPATSVIRLGGPDTSSAREITAYTSQAILFPTRLQNSDLAALTA